MILDKLFEGRGCDELFAVGKTKILIRNELVGLLEKAKAKAVSIFMILLMVYREILEIKLPYKSKELSRCSSVLLRHKRINRK